MTTLLRTATSGASRAGTGTARPEASTPLEESLSDRELIAATRAGDMDAYAQLYERHVGAVRRLARRLAHHHAEADDVTSEVFAKSLRAITRGRGPTDDALAYLQRSVRHSLASLRVNGDSGRASPCSDRDLDRASLAAFPEHGEVADAFEELPHRFQHVLWWTEIEGATPAQLASDELADDHLSAGAAASLSHRARCALRRSYLRSATRRTCAADGCRSIRAAMPSVALSDASPGTSARVEQHVRDCTDCEAVLVDMQRLAESMSTRTWFGWLLAWVGNLTGTVLRTAAAPVWAPVVVVTTLAAMSLGGDTPMSAIEPSVGRATTIDAFPAARRVSAGPEAGLTSGLASTTAAADRAGMSPDPARGAEPSTSATTDEDLGHAPTLLTAAEPTSLESRRAAARTTVDDTAAPAIGSTTGINPDPPGQATPPPETPPAPSEPVGDIVEVAGETTGDLVESAGQLVDDTLATTLGPTGDLADELLPGSGELIDELADTADGLTDGVVDLTDTTTQALGATTEVVDGVIDPIIEPVDDSLVDALVSGVDETTQVVADTVDTATDTRGNTTDELVGGLTDDLLADDEAMNSGQVPVLSSPLASLLG